MREIVLDTETTGLDPNGGDRIVEIGCVELQGFVPTSNVFHRYVNPERDMPDDAFRVHGLTTAFLSDKPVFAEIAGELAKFLDGAKLIAHNASFDIGFLNVEFAALGLPNITFDRVIDTVALARRRFPGAQVSLDALCRRFEIDLSAREKHGALLDAELLASVYLELMGGRQPALTLAAGAAGSAIKVQRVYRPPRHFEPDAAELAAHAAFLEQITDPIWLRSG